MAGYVISLTHSLTFLIWQLTHPLTFLIWQLTHAQAALNPAWAGLLVVGTYMPLDNDGERSCGHDVKGVGEADSQGQALSLLSQRLQQLQLQRAAYAPSSVHPTSLLAQAGLIRALCVWLSARPPSSDPPHHERHLYPDRHAMHCASGPSESCRPLSSGPAY